MGSCQSICSSGESISCAQELVEFMCSAQIYLGGQPCNVSCTMTTIGLLKQILGDALALLTVQLPDGNALVANGCVAGAQPMNIVPATNGNIATLFSGVGGGVNTEAISAAIREANRYLTIPGYNINFASNPPSPQAAAFMITTVFLLASRRCYSSAGAAIANGCLLEQYVALSASPSAQALQLAGILYTVKFPGGGKTLLPGETLVATKLFHLVCGTLNRTVGSFLGFPGRVNSRGINMFVAPGIFTRYFAQDYILFFTSCATGEIQAILNTVITKCGPCLNSLFDVKFSGLSSRNRREVCLILKALRICYGTGRVNNSCSQFQASSCGVPFAGVKQPGFSMSDSDSCDSSCSSEVEIVECDSEVESVEDCSDPCS